MELSIDTASRMASVALSDDGVLVGEITWRCDRNHTVELMPSIDRLLEQTASVMSDLQAVFVCTGPGTYTGLRVGISTAKGLARALQIPLVGVGRLELDAYTHSAFPGVVVAVHQAGRGEVAWAAYSTRPWLEVAPPQLSKAEEIAGRLSGPLLATGEVDDELLERMRSGSSVEITAPPCSSLVRRASVLAELGSSRLGTGAPAEPAAVTAVYLRPPAIGPQSTLR